MNTRPTPWLVELEQKLLETSSTLAGQPFPIDHLYNIIAQQCPGPFTEVEAMQVSPVLARILNLQQLEFLVQEARQVCVEAADSIAHATLEYVSQRSARISPEQKAVTPAMLLSASPHWSHRHSLAPQGALLLALMWAVLPPGDLPEGQA